MGIGIALLDNDKAVEALIAGQPARLGAPGVEVVQLVEETPRHNFQARAARGPIPPTEVRLDGYGDSVFGLASYEIGPMIAQPL